jgi:hypothetical protein
VRSAFNCVVDPVAQRELGGALKGCVDNYLEQHGAVAFIMPRDLAVCHETGHVIVAVADGVAVERIEVFGRTTLQIFQDARGRPPTRVERRRLVAAGYDIYSKNWGGFSTWGPSPFASDRAGTRSDLKCADPATFGHAVRMLIGGICGEHVLYDGPVPKASSLDETMLSQGLCVARTGSHEAAQSLWNELWRETCVAIKRREAAAREIIAAFDHRDIVGGAELHAIINGGCNGRA